MMRALALALSLLPVADTAAQAAGALPPIVAARIDEDRKACGGEPAIVKPGFVTKKDVNGDGRPDYILNYEHLYCGSMPGFCGSGGCTFVVFASRADTYLKVFEDLVGKVEFKRVGGRSVMLVLQRSGRSSLYWNGQTFSPSH